MSLSMQSSLEICRFKKKKCYHEHDKALLDSPQRAQVNTRESTPGGGRVSDYNPESVLAALSSGPEPIATVEQPEPNPIPSHWLRGFAQAGAQSPTSAHRARRQLNWYKRHRRRTAPQQRSEHYQRYLEEVGAVYDLPKTTVDALLPIYVSLLDDLIPVVDAARVYREHSNDKASSCLVRAICLVISKAKQAAPFLRLRADGPVLPPLDFATSLFTGLDAAVKAELELDRITKIQVLALMHLHNDGLAGMDRASGQLSQAINEAWALSLQWKIPGNTDQEQCDYLWWTLRNLDRLNKPVQGAAPFIIDDSDISIERIASKEESYRSQVMDVSLKLGDLMIKATKVYKASSTAREDDSYLEVSYHIAAMLSCKYSGPATVHYNRRLASAKRILEIISSAGNDNLPPLPVIPYAMSMSTTMIYRAFSDKQETLDTTLQNLNRCCEALDVLSRRWTSAKGIARLAKRLVKVLSRYETAQHKLNKSSERIGTNYGRDRPSTADTDQGPRPGGQSSTSTLPTSLHPQNVLEAAPSDLVDTAELTFNPQSNMAAQRQEDWQALDASYTQLDRAFSDLYDYGMPNAFRDPATWEILHYMNEEASSTGGSDFQVPTYFSPDIDFGYTGIGINDTGHTEQQ
ncbi:uncharacterized protein HMPREF1541_02591 [Cyphellophora europaea CBS 101466]|uniref:Transcription factor domain-containing protein n=1 Tax=Cyphellophora europaea (strain CBS 101466) TaxID=1220924 RepID=W2S434_CYPE1|nr:uncharacterized protein HMPREF1541_02591 [Cyphellophora europaea CBS 101466]ETN43432.1 hypothetical protein HMPREF1541_02591 [Cyphellophora europaea CBS 101466]